jgi:hypothetical protein
MRANRPRKSKDEQQPGNARKHRDADGKQSTFNVNDGVKEPVELLLQTILRRGKRADSVTPPS